MQKTLLAGDIGGTKCNLGIFGVHGGKPVLIREDSLMTRDFSSFEALIRKFLGDEPLPHAACLGVAGPVRDGVAFSTNLPWSASEGALFDFGFARARIINDLIATTYGLELLRPDKLFALKPGVAKSTAPRVLLAAGTGLGEAIMVWDGTKYLPVASEGGHTDFGPRNAREAALLAYLAKKHGHVSYERILSGPGLCNIHEFLVAQTGACSLGVETPEEISTRGIDGTDPESVEALTMFCSIYGAEAGNLCLKALAEGGVYVGGGIAPKILPQLASGGFVKAFLDKGRMGEILADIPVFVITEPKTALLGAALFGARELMQH